MVYDRAEDLDVFERIYNKISDLDVDRLGVESQLKEGIDKCLKMFDEFRFKFDTNESLMKSINTNIDQTSMSVHELRDYVSLENKRFLDNFNKVNKNFVDDLAQLRQSITQAFKEIQEDKYDLVKTNSILAE